MIILHAFSRPTRGRPHAEIILETSTLAHEASKGNLAAAAATAAAVKGGTRLQGIWPAIEFHPRPFYLV